MGFMLRHGDENARPTISRALLRRVLGYARPYRRRIVLLLVSILATIGLGLLTPLILRDLIDRTLPAGDVMRLNLLAGALVAIPAAGAVLRIWQRKLDATIGSGIIFDLRCSLYGHLQRMSLRFFTANKTGELLSRLNSDVVGAQNAVTNTMVDITTNVISVSATVAVMLALEWRLTVLGLLVLPAFAFLGRRFGKALRQVSRELMERNARMGAIMNETLNISGMLLVKLFGRRLEEQRRFGEQARAVREGSVRQAVVGSRFFIFMGIATAVGTAAIYLLGGHLVIRGALSVGTVVAFSTYLTQLYGPLRSLSNVPVVGSAISGELRAGCSRCSISRWISRRRRTRRPCSRPPGGWSSMPSASATGRIDGCCSARPSGRRGPRIWRSPRAVPLLPASGAKRSVPGPEPAARAPAGEPGGRAPRRARQGPRMAAPPRGPTPRVNGWLPGPAALGAGIPHRRTAALARQPARQRGGAVRVARATPASRRCIRPASGRCRR